MPSEADLMAAIDAAPDDDAPRLAHADWLEANGNAARAEFIRRQLADGKGDPKPWTHGLPTINGMSWGCRRGYPEVVRFRSLAAFKSGWPLTAGHRVRHVVFDGLRGSKVGAEPALSSIAGLGFSEVAAADILGVLRSPRLGPLRHLEVRAWPADAAFLARLAELPAMAGLCSLSINHSSDRPLDEGALAALAHSPHLARLRSLVVMGWIDEGGMRALWTPGALAGLVSLELHRPGTYSDASRQGGLDGLGDGAAMPALERFVFAPDRHEGGDPALAVARATRWTALRVLDLSRCRVGDDGVIALAGASHLSRLEDLRLERCCVSDTGASALARSRSLASLATLDLGGNEIGRAGVAAFGRSTSLPVLGTLRLKYNPAPVDVVERVEARFRDGGPPLAEESSAPLPAVPAPSAQVIGDADEDGLVRAIWADPWDELARLAYADWLEEQGATIHAAVLREQAPVAGLAAYIEEDAPCKADPAVVGGLVRVALPVRSLKSKAFVRDGPAWLRRHHVAEVRLDGSTRDWAGVFAGEWLAQTRGLLMPGDWFVAWEALAGSPCLEALASLDLGAGIMEKAKKVLGGLRGLCRLVVDRVLPEEMQALANSPFAPNLRHLSLGTIFDVRLGIPFLANAPALAGVVTLDLARSAPSGSCLRLLADGTGLSSLRNLDVSGGRCGDLGMDALAGSELLARLGRLRISARGVKLSALERLARALPPRGLLVLPEGTDDPIQEGSLREILGDRLIVE